MFFAGAERNFFSQSSPQTKAFETQFSAAQNDEENDLVLFKRA